ncbi:hypothetical protein FG386_001369 [Cryptosporidium ryanae]|uniref:uncharacterized protein n=1 Tax=Cryptosporidium ryanae TaxID=515981 RepID=UPI00351A9FC0|nr:hypothetical protein FG386_001369 [Cryptosporidium ryanae]
MNNDDEKILQKRLVRAGNSKISNELKERLIKATKVNDQFEVKVNKKKVLEQNEYYNKLNDIIRDDYYPDLNYLNKNKGNYEIIKRSINDLPGTLSQNQVFVDDIDLNKGSFDGGLTLKDNGKMNVSEFQSKYTNKNNVSFLELENKETIKKRQKLYWIEEQSIKHNLNREINLINSEMRASSFKIGNTQASANNKDDSTGLILPKSEPRTAFMFGTSQADKNSSSSSGNCKSDTKKINPNNTRYNTDGRELLSLNRERLSFLRDIRSKKRGENELEDETKLFLKSPLVKNALRKSKGDLRYVDYELRSSYSSYKGKKSNRSFSRTTKL